MLAQLTADGSERLCIIQGMMLPARAHSEPIGEIGQAGTVLVQRTRKGQGVEEDHGPRPTQGAGDPPENRHIESLPVVGYQHVVAHELPESRPHVGEHRCATEVLLRVAMNCTGP